MVFRCIAVMLLLGLGPLPELPAAAQTLAGVAHWSGSVTLGEAVNVPNGATLLIEAGTRIVPQSAEAVITVNGKLLIEGTKAAPVIFDSPNGWGGIVFVKGEPGSRIRHARFARAASAVSAVATEFTVVQTEFRGCEFAMKLEREASPLIEDSRFVDNGIGIDSEMKSIPKV